MTFSDAEFQQAYEAATSRNKVKALRRTFRIRSVRELSRILARLRFETIQSTSTDERVQRVGVGQYTIEMTEEEAAERGVLDLVEGGTK